MVEKKKNFIAAYFTPFGLKQLCDILMIVGGILMIVGLSVSAYTFVVALVGTIFMLTGSALALIRSISVLRSGSNKRSSKYKNAIINTVIMGIVFALALFITIYIPVALL